MTLLLSPTDPLPKCVYLKHGKYYFVKDNKWHPLGAERSHVLKKIKAIRPEQVHSPIELEDYLRRKTALLKARPSVRTGRLKEVTITPEYVIDIAKRNEWRCAVSGIKMSIDKVNGGRPYAPSIDRIDSSSDYHPGNVRVVCIAVNLAMNVWGEEVFRKIAAATRSARRVLDK